MHPSRRILPRIVCHELEGALLVGLGPDPCILLIVHTGLQKVADRHKEEDTLDDKKTDENRVLIIKVWIVFDVDDIPSIPKSVSIEQVSAGGPDCDKPRH